MGRTYTGKSVKDTETASESIINNSLVNSTFGNLNKSVMQMTVTAHLQSDHQIDDFEVKKSKE